MILDAESLEELRTIVRKRIRYYNRVGRHSSLRDRPPMETIQDFYHEDRTAQSAQRSGVQLLGVTSFPLRRYRDEGRQLVTLDILPKTESTSIAELRVLKEILEISVIGHIRPSADHC